MKAKTAKKDKEKAPETTKEEAIAIAKQLRLDQGRDKLLAFLEAL